MPTQPPPPPQEYARVALIIVLIFFLWTTPDQPQGFNGVRDFAAERIARTRHALNVLNGTRWGDFSPKGGNKPAGEPARYLNLTGFREGDEYAWERLDAFKKRCEEYSLDARGRYRKGTGDAGAGGGGLEGNVYENVTGIVHGKWTRHVADLNGEQRKRAMNLTSTSPLIDWAFTDEEYWRRNITGSEGKLLVRVDERHGNTVYLPESPDPLASSINLARQIEATVTIQDESSSGDGWNMKVHGVHWPKQGVLLMSTTSEKFQGIFGLPHLTSNTDQYLASQQLLNITAGKALESMQRLSWMDQGNPWTATPEAQNDAFMPVPACEMVIYMQVYPLKIDPSRSAGYLDPSKMISQIEQELRFPNGAPTPEAPELQMSAVMFSPDCGFMLESIGPPAFVPSDGEHLVGKKQEVYLSDAKFWLRIFTCVMFGQMWLLKMQSKEASTPSTVGRVSWYTLGMMLMMDAVLFSTLSAVSATAPNIFPSALLASFCCMMSLGLGARFIGAVYNSQEPERREALRLQQAAEAANAPPRPSAATPAPAPIITAAGVETLPPPAPANTFAANAPIIIPSDQDIDAEIAEIGNSAAAVPLLPTTNRPPATQATPQARQATSFGAVYVRFILIISFILFVSISATSWSVPFRSAYVYLMSFIYLSFWLPQIRRNVIRNCRKALLWKFIIGQSVLRLVPFAYFFLKEDNVLFAETDWTAFYVLAGWVWIQVWVLVAQEILGPRWGLPKHWTTEGWDYHPILSEDNIESGGLPIGLVQIPGSPTLERTATSEDMTSRKKTDSGMRSVDCAICMQVLEIPVVPAGGDTTGAGAAGGVAGLLARRMYMVTPCRHAFHSTCLEGWMRFRLQCPICRENLPPL